MRLFVLFLILFQSFSLFTQSSFQLSPLNFKNIEEHTALRKNHFNRTDSSDLNHLIEIKKEKWKLSFNPAFEFQMAIEDQEDFLNRFGLGGQLNWSTKKLSFKAVYLYNSGQYMAYRKERINSLGQVPSMHGKKGLNKIDAYYLESSINYKPSDHFNFELGYGRNFIGDGYRSLLHSDFANSMPYFKMNTSFWKFEYSNIFTTNQQTYNVEGNSNFYSRKYTASHFLDFNVTDWLSIGLFETVIWQHKENNYTRGFDVNYVNPVIFYRPVEFSLGSSDNVMIGANLKIKLFKKGVFYSQLLFDELLVSELRADFRQLFSSEDIQSGWWGNKYGLQFGYKHSDVFNLEGLYAQFEYNLVRPFTYAHSSPAQAYSHYNMPLAHPLGANFKEFIAIINYQKNKWTLRGTYVNTFQGISPIGFNYGENVEQSNQSREKEYENYIGQGITTTVNYFDVYLSYRFQEAWNANIAIGTVFRDQLQEGQYSKNKMVYLSIRTNLFNQYFDY